ncbi:MAG: YigZ family protein [Prevotella sp.]|nr:YigZ family protein [Prevotella sp.]
MVADSYTTIKGSAEGYFTDKRSRFYAFAHHVGTADEAKVLLAEYRRKYHDARHVCWAYRLGPDGAEYRYNDDGEPSSTAGKPIYGQLVSRNLTDIAVFVVRYYGGINLGTSGLIIAYREAAADALAKAQTEERFVETTTDYTFPYPALDRVMRVVRDTGARIVSQNYDTTCSVRLAIRSSKASLLKKKLDDIAFS